MTSVRLPALAVAPASVARLHASRAKKLPDLLVHGEAVEIAFQVPYDVKDDHRAIFAHAVIAHANLAIADTLNTCRACHSDFRRPQIDGLVCNKIHGNSSTRQTSDRSRFYLRFSSGLHHPVTFSICVKLKTHAAVALLVNPSGTRL